MASINPYAAPTAPVGAGPVADAPLPDDFENELRSLDESLAALGALDREKTLETTDHFQAVAPSASGGWGSIGLSLAMTAVLAVWLAAHRLMFLSVIVVVNFATNQVVSTVVRSMKAARALKRRADRRTPADAVRAYFTALDYAQGSLALAALAPHARAGTIETPNAAPATAGVSVHELSGPGLTEWAHAVTCGAGGAMRAVKVVRADEHWVDARAAVVRVELEVRSTALVPNVLGYALLWGIPIFGIIVASAILYGPARKLWSGVASLRCARAIDGTWYLLEPWGARAK